LTVLDGLEGAWCARCALSKHSPPVLYLLLFMFMRTVHEDSFFRPSASSILHFQTFGYFCEKMLLVGLNLNGLKSRLDKHLGHTPPSMIAT